MVAAASWTGGSADCTQRHWQPRGGRGGPEIIFNLMIIIMIAASWPAGGGSADCTERHGQPRGGRGSPEIIFNLIIIMIAASWPAGG
jgi:hypothetical protein